MLNEQKQTLMLVNNPLVFTWTALSLGDVALFDEEIIDFSCLVDVDLDQRSGLGQPQPALPPALVQQGLLVLQVSPRDQPHHLAELGRNQRGSVKNKGAVSG